MNTLFNDKISIFGTFKNKNFEIRYLKNSFANLKSILILCMFLVSSLFLLFSFEDYFTGGFALLFKVFPIRIASIAVILIFYLLFGRCKDYSSYLLTVSLQELFFIASYLFIMYQYPRINFELYCIDIIIIITLYFFIPNLWLSSVILSFTLMLSFFIYYNFNINNFFPKPRTVSGSACIIIIFIINAINSNRTYVYKRTQFYDNLMLRNLLNTDALTGACTRIKFDKEIKEHIEKTSNSDYVFSLAIFDIDNFKRINDTYGHLEGDKILTGLADIVSINKRSCDILTRWGGEEFVIVFPSTSLLNAVKISERIRTKIAETVFSIKETVTCSFGVTQCQLDDTESTLMRRADKYLYDAKAKGKNAVSYG